MIPVLLLTLISFLALASDGRHVLVQGNCEIKVIPDRGSVVFTAENQSRDQKEAFKKTTDQITSLKTKIQKLNLADVELKTSHYQVYPVREYENNRYVDKGTKASQGLVVTSSEIDRLGEAMHLASQAGIQNVGSLQTFLSPTKTLEEHLRCLDVAALNARKKAEQLGRKLGFKVGDVIKINEVPPAEPLPVFAKSRGMGESFAMAAPPGDSPQIDAGEQIFSTSIQVSFSIR